MSPAADVLHYIPQQLADVGYCIIEDAVPKALSQSLYQRVTSLHQHGFSPAGIGRQENHQQDNSFRGDKIHWLNSADAAETAYLSWMGQLRLAVNRQLFMGLLDYEAHFSHYAPGTFYKRHLDAFQGSTNRVLSTVFYLNPIWSTNDGGELLLYDKPSNDVASQSILPHFGTLVVFLSDQFPHEVLTTQRDRYSIAGWFRGQSATSFP